MKELLLETGGIAAERVTATAKIHPRQRSMRA
jgi:hypothetical protein